LVAKGLAQTKGVDFSETFTLLAKFTSIGTLFALITTSNFEIHQMDVKCFLKRDLIENVFMKQLEGYEIVSKTNLVRKLRKSICGLK
jgi:hypothetical protein